MRISVILIVTIFLIKSPALGQYFEGEISFKNYYVDKDSLNPLFDSIDEIVSIKGSKSKSFMPYAEKGALEWEINDYLKNITYSRKSYKNIGYFVTDKEPIVAEGEKIIFQKPDSQLVAPIMRQPLCLGSVTSSDSLIHRDETFQISGFACNLIIRYSNGVKTSEYYYTDSIKISPTMYDCQRTDHLTAFYKLTNGSFIMQLVEYGDLFIWIQQAKIVERKKISDSVFDLPKGINIVDYK